MYAGLSEGAIRELNPKQLSNALTSLVFDARRNPSLAKHPFAHHFYHAAIEAALREETEYPETFYRRAGQLAFRLHRARHEEPHWWDRTIDDLYLAVCESQTEGYRVRSGLSLINVGIIEHDKTKHPHARIALQRALKVLAPYANHRVKGKENADGLREEVRRKSHIAQIILRRTANI